MDFFGCSYIYLVEWKCVGCGCRKCPNPNGEGLRLMRYNQGPDLIEATHHDDPQSSTISFLDLSAARDHTNQVQKRVESIESLTVPPQDRLTRWDGDSVGRRSLDYDRYALRFAPVTSEDSGTYLCLMNNRQTPDSPVVLTVQG